MADHGEPIRLSYIVQHSVQLIRMAIDELDENSGPGRKAALVLLTHAADKLEAALTANCEAAQLEVRDLLVDALGPNLSAKETDGIRRALELILRHLPVPDPGKKYV